MKTFQKIKIGGFSLEAIGWALAISSIVRVLFIPVWLNNSDGTSAAFLDGYCGRWGVVSAFAVPEPVKSADAIVDPISLTHLCDAAASQRLYAVIPWLLVGLAVAFTGAKLGDMSRDESEIAEEPQS